jgi:hypothetical protein
MRRTNSRTRGGLGKVGGAASGGASGDTARTWRRPGVILGIGVAGVVLVAAFGLVLWLVRGDGLLPPSGSGSSSADVLEPMPGPDPGLAHVHGLGVDPDGGMLYAASHYGVFRVPAGGEPVRVANRYQDTMGFVVAGPGRFLGSGHPDPREDLPSDLGLIESTDSGKTWQHRSLSGEADLHALEYKHGAVYAFDAATSRLIVTHDMTHWDERNDVPMADFAVSPADPDVILATTEQGLARSANGGRQFSILADAPPLVWLSWPEDRALFGVSPDGVVLASGDGGATWQRRGSLDGQPSALTAVDAATVYAATEAGIFASGDAGRTFTVRHRISGQ